MTLHTDYFYGNQVSEEGRKYGYLDYGTLAKAFNHVMANGLISKTYGIGEWLPVDGHSEWDNMGEDETEPAEIFQWFIVDDAGREILMDTDEILYENEELGITLWGVTHWGTSWDYVLTNIKINQPWD